MLGACGLTEVERRYSAPLGNAVRRWYPVPMEFRLLGPLEVVADDGAPFGVDAPKPRALLALLLLDANEIVPAERLIEELWGGRAPPSAPKLVQTYVSQLRRALGRHRIVTRTPGYMISIIP